MWHRQVDQPYEVPPSYLDPGDPPDEDDGAEVTIVCCSVVALSTMFAAARFFVRSKFLGRLFVDDYLIIVSLIMAWIQIALEVVAVQNGAGRHFFTLTLEQKADVIKYTVIGFSFGILSYGVPKLAAVALLTRLLNPSRLHRMFLWALASVCLVQLTVMAAIRASTIRLEGEEAYSPPINVSLGIYGDAFSVATDLYLAVYPAVVLSKLNLSKRKKWGLSLALGMGFLATIVAGYKCSRIPRLSHRNFSFYTADLVIWTCVEGSTLIIASCIPTLKPLVDWTSRRLQLGLTTHSTSHYNLDNPGERNGRTYATHSHKWSKGRTTNASATLKLDQLSHKLSFGDDGITHSVVDVKAASTGSQESILPASDHLQVDSAAKAKRNGKGRRRGEDGQKGSKGQNGIMRTRDVMITYEDANGDAVDLETGGADEVVAGKAM